MACRRVISWYFETKSRGLPETADLSAIFPENLLRADVHPVTTGAAATATAGPVVAGAGVVVEEPGGCTGVVAEVVVGAICSNRSPSAPAKTAKFAHRALMILKPAENGCWVRIGENARVAQMLTSPGRVQCQ